MNYALIGSNLLMVTVFAIFFKRLPPQLPLFLSKVWGEDQLAELWMIILIPFCLDLFYFLNSFVNDRIFPENKYVTKLFKYVNLFLIISFTFIFLKIIFTVV